MWALSSPSGSLKTNLREELVEEKLLPLAGVVGGLTRIFFTDLGVLNGDSSSS